MERGRVRGRRKPSFNGDSPASAAERNGCGPKISVKDGFLVVRWNVDQTAEAMDSAEMSLADVLETHIFPRLEAKKTLAFRYCGQITDQYEIPDVSARLRAVKLMLQILREYPEKD